MTRGSVGATGTGGGPCPAIRKNLTPTALNYPKSINLVPGSQVIKKKVNSGLRSSKGSASLVESEKKKSRCGSGVVESRYLKNLSHKTEDKDGNKKGTLNKKESFNKLNIDCSDPKIRK
jgi:hypothetical protein